jgi:hypothetical protein
MTGDWPVAATSGSAYIAGTTAGTDDGSLAWRDYSVPVGIPKARFGDWIDLDGPKKKKETDMEEYLYEVFFVDAKTGTVYGSELATGESETEAAFVVSPPDEWEGLPKTRKRTVFQKVGAFAKYKGEDE